MVQLQGSNATTAFAGATGSRLGMQLLQVIGNQDLLPFASAATIRPVHLFVHPMSIAVAVLELISAALTTHEGDDF